jgi:PelA/Pel-15E family pectate lyase
MRNLELIRPRICLFILIYGCLCVSMQAAGFSWDRYKNRSNEWFRSEQGQRIANNILRFQGPYGSWPKNIDTAFEQFSEHRDDLEYTFDNGATTGEMRFMARAFNATEKPRYKESFLKGLDLILKVQYPSGGWPQRYPPGNGYHRHITFNDGTMVHLMDLLREIANDSAYDFVDSEKRNAVRKAFDAGIACILKCQIRVDGKLTVWCAQHDEIDYHPRPGR